MVETREELQVKKQKKEVNRPEAEKTEKEQIVYVTSTKHLIEVLKNMEDGQMLTLMFGTPEEGEVHGKEE